MSVWQALAIGLWVALVQGRFWGGAVTLNMRFSPLVTSLVVGLVLGNVGAAVATGAAIQVITMGQVAPGGQMPSEPNVAAAIAVPISIMNGLDPAAAVAIAVPIGILGGYLYQFKQFLNTFPLRYVEKLTKNLEDKKFTAAIFLVPQVVSIIVHVPILFVALYFGADVVSSVVTQLEGGRLFHVLSVVGGALGAVGIALLLRLIGRKEFMWFFFLAFFARNMLATLNVSTVTWAIMGVLTAGIYILIVRQGATKNAS